MFWKFSTRQENTRQFNDFCAFHKLDPKHETSRQAWQKEKRAKTSSGLHGTQKNYDIFDKILGASLRVYTMDSVTPLKLESQEDHENYVEWLIDENFLPKHVRPALLNSRLLLFGIDMAARELIRKHQNKATVNPPSCVAEMILLSNIFDLLGSEDGLHAIANIYPKPIFEVLDELGFEYGFYKNGASICWDIESPESLETADLIHSVCGYWIKRIYDDVFPLFDHSAIWDSGYLFDIVVNSDNPKWLGYRPHEWFMSPVIGTERHTIYPKSLDISAEIIENGEKQRAATTD